MNIFKIVGAVILWLATAYLVAAVIMSSMLGEWGHLPFIWRLVFLIPAAVCFHYAMKLTPFPKSWTELG